MTRAPQGPTTLPDDRIGRRIADRYRLVAHLGSGGMSTVYLARDERLDREVALKVFRPELASADDLRRRQGEIRILASLHHPSLVTLYDAVPDDDGQAALVLEYVPGSDVRTRIASGPLPARSVAAIGRDVGRALAHIHARGIVHRDVAPGNILLTESEARDHGIEAKLTDLGIARLVDEARTTSTGAVVGTAHYLSPEQVQGETLTPASDVYSLGLVLLECLSGERAFPGAAVESALARLSRDPSIPDWIDPEWRELLEAMTHREPGRRPAAAEVAASLAELATRTTPEASPAPTVVPPPPPPGTAPTRRMTATDLGTTAKTERLPSPTQPRTAPARRPSRRLPILLLGLTAMAAILIVLLTVVPRSLTPAAPEPAPSYPAVPGQLGDHLRQLEHDVDPGQAP